jgi:hypothetical protein
MEIMKTETNTCFLSLNEECKTKENNATFQSGNLLGPKIGLQNNV